MGRTSSGISPYRKDGAQGEIRPSKSPIRASESRATSRASARPKPEWNYSTKTIDSPDSKRGDKRKPPTIKNSPEEQIQQYQFKTIIASSKAPSESQQQQQSSRNVSNLRSKISMPTTKGQFISL
jgi:hypothetical protein